MLKSAAEPAVAYSEVVEWAADAAAAEAEVGLEIDLELVVAPGHNGGRNVLVVVAAVAAIPEVVAAAGVLHTHTHLNLAPACMDWPGTGIQQTVAGTEDLLLCQSSHCAWYTESAIVTSIYSHTGCSPFILAAMCKLRSAL